MVFTIQVFAEERERVEGGFKCRRPRCRHMRSGILEGLIRGNLYVMENAPLVIILPDEECVGGDECI